MQNEIFLGMATVTDHKYIINAVDSILEQDLESKIFIVSNSSKCIPIVNELFSLHNEIIVPFYSHYNLGVSASWNLILEQGFIKGYPFVIIIGDDITFLEKDSLTKFKNAVKDNPNNVYYVYNRGFSAFCITKEVWSKIGKFDEGFWPGYFED